MKFFVITVSLIFGLSASALRVVNERNDAVALGFEISNGMARINELEEEKRQLRIDRAALLDPKRLAPLAQQHGLRIARPDQIVTMTEGDDDE